VPIFTARRAIAPIIERLSYGAMGSCSSRLYLSQDRQNIGREGVRSLPVCGHALCLRIPQISAVSTTPVPESKMASCLSQGKYIDTLTHECTATRTAPPPVLSAQQQARQDRFEAGANGREMHNWDQGKLPIICSVTRVANSGFLRRLIRTGRP
jgi:hypothetical protein